MTPLGFGIVCSALVCATAIGAAVGGRLKAARATEAPATAVESAPPPVSVADAATPEAHALEPEVDTPPAIGPQVNLAILVVDSFDAPSPKLQAVWLAALHTELQTAYLLGLSPYLWVATPERGELRLREAYTFDAASGGGGPQFDAALAHTAYEPPIGTVTIDALMLSEIVNRLGGVDMMGVRMDGAGAAAYAIIGVPDEPLAQSDRQAELAGAVRDAAAVSVLDMGLYLDLILEQGRTTLSPDTLRALALAFQGYNPAGLIIAPPVTDPQLVIQAPDGLPAVLLAEDYIPSSQTAAFGQ